MNFHAEFVVTEKCNFNCEYCYMNNRASEMSKDIFDAHIRFLPTVLKEYNCDKYVLTFFGGEPLMNWPLIEYALPILQADNLCSNIVMPTNAILITDEKLEILKRYNVFISVSYDGLWQKTGQDEILKLKEKYDIHAAKVMISPDRSTPLVDNYLHFVETMDMRFPDFTIVRDNVWTDKDVDIFEIELKELADKVIELNESGPLTLPGIFFLYIADTLIANNCNAKRSFGCFAGIHGSAFMPDGNVYPCARFGTEKEYITFNSIYQTRYVENIDLLKHPKISNPQHFEKCQYCELYKYCNAGCTYSQLKNNNQPVEGVCKLFKIIYKEAFRVFHALKHNKEFMHYIKSRTGE